MDLPNYFVPTRAAVSRHWLPSLCSCGSSTSLGPIWVSAPPFSEAHLHEHLVLCPLLLTWLPENPPCGHQQACMLSRLSRVRLCATPWTLQPIRLLCPWDSPGKNTGMGCHALLQGIFLTQGLNPRLYVSCVGRWVLYL